MNAIGNMPRARLRRNGVLSLTVACLTFALCRANAASAAFTTVINSPPDVLGDHFDFFRIGSNTQLNLFEGANVSLYQFPFGDAWEPSDNIELNLEGGTIDGYLLATSSAWAPNTNVVINIRSGVVVGSIDVNNGNEVNVFGGKIGHRYWAEEISLTDGSSALIAGGEIVGDLSVDGGSMATVSGGSIDGSIYVRNGSDVTISGGRIGSGRFSGGVGIQSGSTARMTGGVMEGFGVSGGSTATISGGTVSGYVSVSGNSDLEIRGGWIPSLSSDATSRMSFVGGDFRLNGAPIAGLAAPGSEAAVNLPERGVVTGVLTDGSVIVLTQQGYHGDWLPDGSLHLASAAIPSVVPKVFNVPGMAAPRFLRAGERLQLHDGGMAPANFRAAWGSTMRIDGGEVGPRLRAAGAVIDLVDGQLGELAVLTMGSVLNVSGGIVSSNLNAASGSTVNVTGGYVDGLFEALDGSRVSLAGGVIAPLFYAHPGSRVTISGSGFRINGVPVSGLNAPGATRQVDVPAGGVLSGTYADGRQFAFSDGVWDYMAAGTLTLQASLAPASGPTVIRVPNDPAPVGLRTGQSLLLSDGGVVGDDFNADWGSVVNIDGGQIGNGFEAVGALVNITGGSAGWRLDALYGTVVNIAGGSLEGLVRAHRGALINMSGGTVGLYLEAHDGGVVNVSGGTIGPYANASRGAVLNISGGQVGRGLRTDGATLNLSGGQIGGEVGIWSDSHASISGGTIGDEFQLDSGSRLLITGGDFRLDGAPIEGLPEYGASSAITIPAGSVLSGTLQDGTPFAFSDLDRDSLQFGSVRLFKWYNALPSPPIVDFAGFPAPAGVQGGAALTIDAANSVGDNFGAAWGSTVTMIGGSMGANFEAVGSQVLITGGVIGDDADAFFGSTVTITGGSIGGNFTAHNGSVVNILGGEIGDDLRANAGSIVNIYGGELESALQRVAGSEVHFFGTDFELDGAPIVGFGPGQTVTVAALDGTLTGRLSDGTELEIWLSSGGYNPPPASPPAVLTLSWTLAADFDHDQDVDADDLARWQCSFSAAGPGATDGDDFLVWQRQLGGRAAAPASSGLPEPVSLSLALFAVVSLAARRVG